MTHSSATIILCTQIQTKYNLDQADISTPIKGFGHLMRRVDSLEKTDAGRDGGQEQKGTTEDETAGWHH